MIALAQGRAALSEDRRELRVARQQEAGSARARARQWELSPLHKAVVLIAYGLAAYEAEASVMYLGALGRQRAPTKMPCGGVPRCRGCLPPRGCERAKTSARRMSL